MPVDQKVAMVAGESSRQQGLLPQLHAAAFRRLKQLQVEWKQPSLPGDLHDLRKYADLAPSAEVFARLGEEHQRQGAFDRAETCANVALVMDSLSVVALVVRAQCRLHRQDIVGAKQDFDVISSDPHGHEHKGLVRSARAQLKQIAAANKKKRQRGGMAADNLAGTLAAADATREGMLKAASRTAKLALLRFAKQQEQQQQQRSAQAVTSSAGPAEGVRAPQGGLPQCPAQAAHGKQQAEESTIRAKQALGTAAAVAVGSSTPVLPVAEVTFAPSRAELAKDATAQHQRDCRVKQLGDQLSINYVQQIAALEALHAAERQQLKAKAAELLLVSKEAISNSGIAIENQKASAQALAVSIAERQKTASELTNQQAQTHQLQSEYERLNSKMSQVTATFKALQTEHTSCGESLRACTAQKQAAEQTLQQRDSELQTLTGSLQEARCDVEQLQRQVQQQTDALTAEKAASEAADRQISHLEADLAKDAECLTACTADKTAIEEQLREQLLLTQQVQQQLDELHRIRHEEQHLAEQRRTARQQAVDAAVQTKAQERADAAAQTSSAPQMDAVVQPGALSTAQNVELATAAEANAKMQRWMIELYKLQTEQHRNQVHLRSANTALKRHVAGVATHGQKEEKARSQLEDIRILAEQEAEKLHVDCCQLEVSLWLLNRDNSTVGTDDTCNTEPAPAVSSKKANQQRRKREKEARRKACLSQDAADASMTEPALDGGAILADRSVTPSTGAVQPMNVDTSPDAAASASITDAVKAQLTFALDAATAVNSPPGAAAVGIHQAETAQPVSGEITEPVSAESISAEIAENVIAETAETVSLETVRAEIAELSAEAEDHQSSAALAVLQQTTEPAAADLQQAMQPSGTVSQVIGCSSPSQTDSLQPYSGASRSASLLQKVDFLGPSTQAPAEGSELGKVGQILGLLTGDAPAASPEISLSISADVQADLHQAETGCHASAGGPQADPSGHRLYTVWQDKAPPPYMPPATAIPLYSRPAKPPVPVYSPPNTPLYSPPGSPFTPPQAEMQQTISAKLEPRCGSPESTATDFNDSLQHLPAHLQQALGAQRPIAPAQPLSTEQPPCEVQHLQVTALPPQQMPNLSQRPRHNIRVAAENQVRTHAPQQQDVSGQVASCHSRVTTSQAQASAVSVGRPQGSWAKGTLTGQLRQAAAAPQPAPLAVPPAPTSNSSGSEVQPRRRGPNVTAPTTVQSAERGQSTRPAVSNRSRTPAARGGVASSHPMPLVGHPRRVPPQGSRPQDYHNDSDKAWCQLCVMHGWAWYRTIRGDGECGFRAMAVGAIMAVHRLPNWQIAAPAFARHVASLFASVRPGLKKVQQARPDGATAQQGLLFFQTLVTDGRLHDPAALSAACADPTNANSLVQLMRCIACESLMRKDESQAGYFDLMMNQYESNEYRPRSMKEACFSYMAHMVVKGRDGAPDPAEPLKQATASVLGLLAEALHMQVFLGSNTGTAHGILEDCKANDGPCWASANMCLLSRDGHFNLAWV